MKNIFTLIMLMLGFQAFPQTVLVDWNFSDESADLVADAGIPENLDKEISTEGGTGAIEFKNGFEGKAAQAAGWDNGKGLKCWVVEFTTSGYDNISFSSRQTSGGTDPGPRDWKVDYRIGQDGLWTEVAGATVVTANDWTTGVLDNISLPDECADQPLVYLRWIMTSDSSTAGGLVEATGKCKIDNILVNGSPMNAVGEWQMDQVQLYPNPATNHFTLVYPGSSSSMQLYNAAGMLVREEQFEGELSVPTRDLTPGLYFVRITDRANTVVLNRKLLVR